MRGPSARRSLVAAAVGLAFGLAAGPGCGKKGAPAVPAHPILAPAPKAAAAPKEKKTTEGDGRRRKEPLLPP